MRKRKQGRKFGRKRDQRKAFLKSLISALLLKEKIKTTEPRAKEISGMTEKFITRAKNDTLANRRLLVQFFSGSTIVKKLFSEIGPRYKERHGGYTRIIKLGPRKTDGAKMAIIELVK
ncbi:MAG: 50S ribosomal protein L17 [Candidatus Nealsonbacteria bacterium]|nr:50S ribosomal protein L17 [Candidatus Nealsonbacteria bacterium]